MSNLHSKLEEIANTFVSSVLAAMKTASLGDLAGEVDGAAPVARASAKRRPGRPAKADVAAVADSAAPVAKHGRRGRRQRASAAQVQAQKDTALAAAKTLKAGFAKSNVMKKSASKVDLGRALSLLVAEGKLTKKGDRRLARYSVK